MKHLLAPLISLAMTACAVSPNKNVVLPAGMATLTPATPIACHYEKQMFTSGKPASPVTNWYFWRDARRTETRDDLTRQGEIWEQDNQGRFTHTHVFFDEKVTLEYNSVDLITIGTTPQWQRIRSLIDPDALGHELKLDQALSEKGIRHERYSGAEDGITTQLDWLPGLGLPAHIEKINGINSFSLKLTGCQDMQHASWKPLSKQEYDRLQHLEYTDLGDMESDPLVKRILARLGLTEHDHH